MLPWNERYTRDHVDYLAASIAEAVDKLVAVADRTPVADDPPAAWPAGRSRLGRAGHGYVTTTSPRSSVSKASKVCTTSDGATAPDADPSSSTMDFGPAGISWPDRITMAGPRHAPGRGIGDGARIQLGRRAVAEPLDRADALDVHAERDDQDAASGGHRYGRGEPQRAVGVHHRPGHLGTGLQAGQAEPL